MQPDPTTVAIRFAKKWKKLPPGWTDESVKKFWETLGKGTPKHKVWNCIEKMTDNIPNPGAFCGGLADWQDPGWRSKAKGESSEARSDAKSYWKGKIKKKKDKKAMDDRTAKGEFPKSLSFPRRQRKTPVRDRKKQRRERQKQRRLEKRASAARVALRYAARNSPPSMMGSAAMLKRQGLTPVDVWFGEVKPHRRPMLELGDMVQNRRGDLLYFAGVAPDGSAILGKDEREAERLNKQVIEDRKHHSSRAAFGGPLMLQPDYGHGDAAVPGDQEYHPCQHGKPCQCGGQCGCGG